MMEFFEINRFGLAKPWRKLLDVAFNIEIHTYVAPQLSYQAPTKKPK